MQPGECYRFWDKHTFGFSEPCRDLVRADVSARVKRQVRGRPGAMLTPTADRLLIKITGWPRIGYLDEIFEDARFIHIKRDGRAVASSLLHVNFWRGWYGPAGLAGRAAVARGPGDVGGVRPLVHRARRSRVAHPDARHRGGAARRSIRRGFSR